MSDCLESCIFLEIEICWENCFLNFHMELVLVKPCCLRYNLRAYDTARMFRNYKLRWT